MVYPGSILYYSGGAGGSRLMYVYYSKSLPLEILRTTTRTVPRVHAKGGYLDNPFSPQLGCIYI